MDDLRYFRHNRAVEELLLRCQEGVPHGRFFRRSNWSEHVGSRRRRRSYRGEADIWGIVRGIHVEVEVKTGFGRLSKYQRRWCSMVIRSGGVYIVYSEVDTDLGLLVGDISRIGDSGVSWRDFFHIGSEYKYEG